MSYKVYRTLQRTQGKMLREYFSGMPVEDLSKRYGYSEKKIISLASEYKLKLSNIKVEGYEIMMHILKDEYGIDLSKKAEAGQSTNSKGDTRK